MTFGSDNDLFVWHADDGFIYGYRRASLASYTRIGTLLPLPDNSNPIGMTYDTSTDTLYVLDSSWQCFAYDVTERSDPLRFTFNFNESRSFNYHRSSTETRTPVDHERFDDGFRILLSDGTVRKQVLA